MFREFRPNLNDIEYKLWLQNYDWFIEHNYPMEEAIKNADKFINNKKKQIDAYNQDDFYKMVNELVDTAREITDKYKK